MTSSEPREAPPAGWARDHLANERTLLAWVRTALTFMAFGVAVAKLAVLLRLAALDHPVLSAALPSPARSELAGVGLIAFGGALALAGALRTRRWARRIDPSRPPPPQRTLALIAGATVALAVALAVYVLV